MAETTVTTTPEETGGAAGGPAGFFESAFSSNPYPLFAALRANTPVMHAPEPGLYIVTRYDDVMRVLRDWETFSSVVSDPVEGEERSPSILFDDPPIHTRMRGLLTKAFTPRVIGEQRPAIEENAARMIDAMLAQDEPDLIASLAYPLPVMVIAGMLGVQDGDMATFKRWSDAIIQNVGNAIFTGDQSALEDVNREFDEYFGARLNKLRQEPEDNLLSELVHAVGEDGSRLSQADLLLVCRVLLVAGNETTTGLIVNSTRAFSEFPDEMLRVKAHPELIPSAIEEALRYYAPFPATFRRTTRDVEVAGTTIPKGSRVLPMIASANRDETQFRDPDRFIADRDPNRHVAFGMGIHYCLGAPLARLEGTIVLEKLLPRITRIEIVDKDAEGVLRPGGPERLRVRFTLG